MAMNDHRVQRATQRLAVAAAFGLLGVALLTTADVLLRYLAGMPIRGMTEVAALSVAVAIAAFCPALVARRANVTIRLLGSLLGPRVSGWLEVFGALVTAGFLGLLAWQLVLYAQAMAEAGEVTPFLRLATAPWWWVVAVAFALAAIVAAGVLVRDIRTASGSAPASSTN